LSLGWHGGRGGERSGTEGSGEESRRAEEAGGGEEKEKEERERESEAIAQCVAV